MEGLRQLSPIDLTLSRKNLEVSKNVLFLGKDTEGRVEKVLARIPLIGSYLKINPFK